MSRPPCTPELGAAVHAAQIAGDHIRETFLAGSSVSSPKGFKDIVTSTDLEAERLIVEHLSRLGHPVWSEELGGSLDLACEGELLWLVDPLDGTINFATGIHPFAVSIALLRRGSPQVAAIYDPLLDKMFRAALGTGAFRGEQQLASDTVDNLGDAVIGIQLGAATGPSRIFTSGELLAWLTNKCRRVRLLGCPSLMLSSVASGGLGAFLAADTKPMDVAAGALLVTEAGGSVSDWLGNEWTPTAKTILASQPSVHNELLEKVASLRLSKG